MNVITAEIIVAVAALIVVSGQNENVNENAFKECRGNKKDCDSSLGSPVTVNSKKTGESVIKKSIASLRLEELPIVPFNLSDKDSTAYISWTVAKAVGYMFNAENVDTSGIAVIHTGNEANEIGYWQIEDGSGDWLSLLPQNFSSLPLEMEERSVNPHRPISMFDWTQSAFAGLERPILLLPPTTKIRFKPVESAEIWSQIQAQDIGICIAFALWQNIADKPTQIHMGNIEQFKITEMPQDCKLCGTLGISSEAILYCPERLDCKGVPSGKNVINQCGTCVHERAASKGCSFPSVSPPNNGPTREPRCKGELCSVRIERVHPMVIDLSESLPWNIGFTIGKHPNQQFLVEKCALKKEQEGDLHELRLVNVTKNPSRFVIRSQMNESVPQSQYFVQCHISGKDGEKREVQQDGFMRVIDFGQYSLTYDPTISPNPVPYSSDRITIKLDPPLSIKDSQKASINCIFKQESIDIYKGRMKPGTRNMIDCPLADVNLKGAVKLWISLTPQMKTHNLIKYQNPIELIFDERPASVKKVAFSESLDALEVHFDRIVDGPNKCGKLFDHDIVEKLGEHAGCKFMGQVLRINLGLGAKVTQGTLMKLSAGAGNRILSMEEVDGGNDGSLIKDIIVTVQNPNSQVKPQFKLDGPKEVKSCENTDKQYKIEVKELRGTGKLPATVTWSAQETSFRSGGDSEIIFQQDLDAAQEKMHLKIPAHKLNSGSKYQVIVQICNVLAQCMSHKHELRTLMVTANIPVFDIEILGDIVDQNQKLKLMAKGIIEQCTQILDPPQFMFHWTIDDVEMGNGPMIDIPAEMLSSNQNLVVELNGTVTTENGFFGTVTKTRKFKLDRKPLEMLSMSKTVTTGVYNKLTVDLEIQEGMNVEWECAMEIEDEIGIIANETCAIDETYMENARNSSNLLLPSSTLNMDSKYYLTAIVSDEFETQQETVEVHVTSLLAPEVKVDPLADQPDPSAPLDLTCTIYGRLGDQIHSQISIPSVQMPQYLMELSKRSIKVESPDKGIDMSFTLPEAGSKKFPNWPGLVPNMEYDIVYSAKNSEAEAETSINVKTNGPPTVGTIIVEPSTGIVALTTRVVVTLTGVQDMPQDYPLQHRFGIIVIIGEKSEQFWIPEMLSITQYSFFLPSANHDANSTDSDCKNRQLQFVVKSCDRLGACSLSYSNPITYVHEATDLELDTVVLPQTLSNFMDHDDTLSAFSLILAIKLDHCDKKREDAMSNKIGHPVFEATTKLISRLIEKINKDIDSGNGYSDYGALAMLNKMTATISQTIASKIIEGESVPSFSIAIKDQLKEMMVKIGETFDRGGRVKRDTQEISEIIHYEKVATLLEAYEILYESSSGSSESHLQFLGDIDFLKWHLCRQAKAGMDAFVMHGNFVKLIVETIDPNVQLQYEIETKFAMSAELKEIYKQWSCNNNQKICSSVCVCSVEILNSRQENPLVATLANDFEGGSGKQPVVTPYLDWLDLRDPITGLSNGAFGLHYTVDLQLNQSRLLINPECILLDQVNRVYKPNACVTSSVNRLNGIPTSITCKCNHLGIVGVHTVEPEVMAAYRPVSISYTLVSVTSLPSTYFTDLETFLERNGFISRSRFRDWNFLADSRTVTFILRPAEKFSEYFDDGIARDVLRIEELIIQYSPHSQLGTPSSFSATSILRDSEDITFTSAQEVHFESKSTDFDAVIGNKVRQMQDRWTKDIAQTIFIEENRIQNLVLSKGSVRVSLRINPPEIGSSEENTPNAGEAALFLKERIKYNEINLTGIDQTPVKFDSDTVEIQNYDPNAGAADDSLYKVIGGVVGALLLAFVIVMAVVLVRVKIKQKKMKNLTTSTLLNSTPLSSAPSLNLKRTPVGAFDHSRSHQTISTLGGSAG